MTQGHLDTVAVYIIRTSHSISQWKGMAILGVPSRNCGNYSDKPLNPIVPL